MLDRLTSMLAFVKAAEVGSFAGAAEILGMSQQMVARHVASLEQHLDTRLINRTTRSQSLTEVGKTYYERCRLVLAEVEAADTLAAEANAEPRGTLQITAPTSFGRYRLMPMLTRFLQQYPEVGIDVALTDRIVDLVEEGFEVAFRIGHMADSRLIARPLAPYQLVTCASPAYLRAHGTPASPRDLKKHACLGYQFRKRMVDTAWQFGQGRKVENIRVHGRIRMNDSMALMAAAVDGLGILLAPSCEVEEALASGKLVRVLQEFEVPPLPIHLVYGTARHQTPKLRRFIDASMAAFG